MTSAEHPRVSVVIPAYRATRTIGRAIDSLLAQTRRPQEILVIDDGSPDDLAAVLAAYGEQVRLHRQPNGGAASARNRGLDLATGELIAFLDADDYWEPHKLQRQLTVLERHPEIGLIASHFYQEPPGSRRYADPLPSSYLFDRVLSSRGTDALRVARRIWTSTVVVRRSVLGDKRFDTSLPTAEDVDLWIRLVLDAPVYLLSEPLATAVLTSGSLSRSNVAADAGNMLMVLQRYADVLGYAGVHAGRSQVYREWAAGHLGNGKPGEAILPAWKRVLHQPWSAQSWWILGKSLVGACNARFTGRNPRAPVRLT